MGAFRSLVGFACIGLIAGCIESSKNELAADDFSVALEAADGPILPQAPAGATCVFIQRGTLGQVQDTDIGYGNGPDWATGAYPFTWTGVSPYDHWSTYQFDLGVVPAGKQIVLATFSNYVAWNDDNATVRAHRITAPWNEATATWNNFGGTASWDPAVLGSFNAGGFGYRSIDVTGLTQSWKSGAVANHGILLEEDPVENHLYDASESSETGRRPSLYVCWVDAQGPQCSHDGMACVSGNDCCNGLACIEGFCGSLAACTPSGSSCDFNDECCSGLVCNSGSCGTPPVACAAAGNACGGGVSCCDGALCNDGVCPGGGGPVDPVCAKPGDDCNADAPCCEGLCNDGVCPGAAVECSGVGTLCNDDATCCSGACFDGMCVSNDTCVSVDVGDACDAANPCCDGAHCAVGYCFNDYQCVPPGQDINPDNDACCWGLDGSTGTCK